MAPKSFEEPDASFEEPDALLRQVSNPRSVTWADDTINREVASTCFSCTRHFSLRLGNACMDYFTVRKRKKSMDKPGKRGYLWKLNADVPVGIPMELACIRNWRCRLFWLEACSAGEYAMKYVSEQFDGKQAHACTVSGASGDLQTLPEVDMGPMSPATRYWTSSNVRHYNVAFGFGKGEQVPSKLYPFAIRWRAEEETERQLVVAAATEASRTKWVTSIQAKMVQRHPMLPSGYRQRDTQAKRLLKM